MSDLKLALRAYVDETIERVDTEDVLRRSDPSRERAGGRRPVTAAVLGAVGIVALVVGTFAAMELIQESPSTPPSTAVNPSTTTTNAPTSTEADTTTTEPTAEAALPIVWSRAQVEAADNASINSVAVADGYLVAVGERVTPIADGAYEFDAAAWVSPDGVTWAAIDSPTFKGVNGDHTDGLGLFDANQTMLDVAAGPLGVLAVGNDDISAAIWISPDAQSWTQVADERLDGALFGLTAAAVGGPGWVAVGQDNVGGGWVWLSPDGIEWTVETEAFSADTNGAPVSLYDVVVFNGQIVVTGRIGYADPAESHVAVWMSSDGTDWEIAAIDDVPPVAISASPDGGTLIGFHDTSFLSSDGVTWTAGVRPSPSVTAHVTFADGWMLAAGMDRWASVWVSTDGGLTWTKSLPDVEGFSENAWTMDLALVGERVVVVGTTPGVYARAAEGNAIGSTAEIWIATWTGS